MNKLKTDHFKHVVLQPTLLCNLNCNYCYLPDRAKKRHMSQEVAISVANSLEKVDHEISIVWHGSEPLTCGLKRFKNLLSPFSKLESKGKISHSIQTNATLINQEWCDLFKKNSFGIGVSLDGDKDQNAARVTWGGNSSFDSAMKGIELLKKNGLSFGVISVVNPENITDPSEFYNFFTSIGCRSLNVNIEEKEGLNRNSDGLQDSKVRKFWQELFEAWRKNPVIKVREFDRSLGWILSNNKKKQKSVETFS